MIKKYILITLLLSFNIFFSQESEKLVSVKFDSINKIEAIKLLELKTNYSFFYIEKWLDNDLISKEFKDVSISEVLEYLFNESNINYFITNNFDIILTEGALIKIPQSFTQTNTGEAKDDSNVNSPVVFNKNDVDYIIGKEDSNSFTEISISGYVKNLKTGKPISGVTIFNEQDNTSTTTDSKGFYSIKSLYGKNRIKAFYYGYKPDLKSILVYGSGMLNFDLLEQKEALDEVIINVESNRNVKQTITGVSNIKAKSIKTIPQVLGERNLLKAAMTLPGIKSAGEGAEGVNVRGGKVDQNLFLLDDGVLYNPTHFLGLFSAVNPFTTDDLKIYKGNIPAEYGGRLSSVFDIKSKKPSTEKIQGELSIGPVTGNLSVELPVIKNKSSLMLGVRSSYSDWILQNISGDNKLENSSVSFYDAIAKYNHAFNKNNSIDITGYISQDKFQIASDSINKYSNKLMTLNWSHSFNEKNRSNLILSHSTYDFNIKYEENNERDFNLNYGIRETYFKLKLLHVFSSKNKLNYGLDSKLYEINPGNIEPIGNNSEVESVSINKEKGLEASAFVSNKLELNEKLSVDYGIRFSSFFALGPNEQRIYESDLPKNTSSIVETKVYGENEIIQNYKGLSYRFSTRYSFDKDLSLKLGVNKSFQYLHRLSNNTTASPLDTWRLSDANIKPQEGLQFSLGLFKNIDEKDLELSIEGYYKKYENLLDYKIGADLLLNQTIETDVLQGPGKSYGIEFLIKKTAGRANGWLGYTYARSLIQLDSEFKEEVVNNGDFFPTNYDKPHSVDLVFNYRITQRYSISSNFTYQTGRPVTYPSGKYILDGVQYVTYSDRNLFRIPDYYRLDLGVNIEGNHKKRKVGHSFWNVSIYNVLGRNNPYSVFFETKDGIPEAFKTSIFSVPIPTITYNLKF